MIVSIVASVGFALSIICLVECVTRLFPKGVTTGRAVFVVLLCLASIILGFVSLHFMSSPKGSIPMTNWIIAIALLVIYVAIRSAFAIVKQIHSGQQDTDENQL